MCKIGAVEIEIYLVPARADMTIPWKIKPHAQDEKLRANSRGGT